MAVTNTGGQLHYIPQCLRPSTLQYTHHSYIVGTESGCRSLVGVLYFYYHHMSESRVHCRGTQHCATRQQLFDGGQQVAMAVRSYLKPITGREHPTQCNPVHSLQFVLWSPHIVPQQCGRATPAPPTITPPLGDDTSNWTAVHYRAYLWARPFLKRCCKNHYRIQ